VLSLGILGSSVKRGGSQVEDPGKGTAPGSWPGENFFPLFERGSYGSRPFITFK
jgi:hypothetical protein